MLAKRVIPCLDVHAGRVTRGPAIWPGGGKRPAQCRRSGRARHPLQRAGRGRTRLLRHHRLIGGPQVDHRRHRTHRRSLLHAPHRRRRCALHQRHAPAAPRGSGQDQPQFGRTGPARNHRGRRRGLRQPVHGRLDRREENRAGRMDRLFAGRPRTGRRGKRARGPGRRSNSARARSC